MHCMQWRLAIEQDIEGSWLAVAVSIQRDYVLASFPAIAAYI